MEEAQRSAANERKVKCEEWVPMYFAQVSLGKLWMKFHLYCQEQIVGIFSLVLSLFHIPDYLDTG